MMTSSMNAPIQNVRFMNSGAMAEPYAFSSYSCSVTSSVGEPMKSAILAASRPSLPNAFASAPDSPSDSTSVCTVDRLSSKSARMPPVWPSASRAATSVEVNWPIANSVWSISRRWFDTAAASEDETALICARLRLTVGTVSPNRPSAYAPAASAAPCTDPSKDVPAWDTARARSPACVFAASRASSVACASAARWSSASATATSGSLAASPSGSA